MMKFHNVLLACALGAASLLGAVAPTSAAYARVGTVRPAATGRVLPGHPYYGAGYRSYGYRYGYAYPYRYGYRYPYRYAYGYPYGYGVGVGVGLGYGYAAGGYGYAPYPAVYAPRPYWVRHPYWRPYGRVYAARPVVR